MELTLAKSIAMYNRLVIFLARKVGIYIGPCSSNTRIDNCGVGEDSWLVQGRSKFSTILGITRRSARSGWFEKVWNSLFFCCKVISTHSVMQIGRQKKKWSGTKWLDGIIDFHGCGVYLKAVRGEGRSLDMLQFMGSYWPITIYYLNNNKCNISTNIFCNSQKNITYKNNKN